MLNSEQFSKMILPLRARQLADRFMVAINDLLCSPAANQYLQRHSSKGFEDLHLRLVQIFKASLDLKAQTAITENEYSFVVHRMGTPLVLSTQPGGSSNDSESHGSATPWLHASFKVYPAGPPNKHNRKSDAIVQTSNFLSHVEGSRMDNCLVEKHIAVRKSERPSFVSEQLPPGKNSGKRPFQSEVQPPRKQKRRRTPPSASANPPGYSQAGENQSNPDLASRTCNDCGQILSSTYNYQRHVADRK